MIHFLRSNRFASQLLVPTILLLVLLPALALASIPVTVDGKPLETVGPRTYRFTNEFGQLETVPDLAVTGQLLVQMWSSANANDLQAALQSTNCTVIKQVGTGLFLLALPQGVSVVTAERQWQNQRGVRLTAANRLMYWSKAPNDPRYSEQWAWKKISAETGWDVTTGSSSSIVAVVDSGVDQLHPDLQSRIWTNSDEIAGNDIDDDGNGYVDDVNGWDFQFNDNDSNPDIGGYYGYASHGTHCAGLVGAATDNSIGVAGHDWNARIMSVKVGNGTSMATTANIILGVQYAVANGADVISMSFGGLFQDIWTQPMTEAWAAGAVCVCAAGNSAWTFTDDPYTWDSPVCNDGDNFTDNHVIGVGATDVNDVCADFTNLDSSSRHFVDVMAPGVNILSTVFYDVMDNMHTYDFYDGTSMACPIVAGLASLVKAQSSNSTPDLVISTIRAACESIDAKNPTNMGKMGAGRINTANSVKDMPPGAARSVMAFDTPGDSGGSITVSWSLSADDGRGFGDVTHYDVLRSETDLGPFTVIGTVDKGTKAYVDAVGSANDYVDYWYEVIAYDKVNSATSKIAGPASSRDDLAPPAVTVSAADTQGDLGGSISLSWNTYVPTSDFREYHIYRAESSFTDVTDLTPLAVVNVKTTKTYQDKTTLDNTDYYYAVTSLDNSKPNNELKEVTCFGPVRSNPNYAFGFAPGLSLVSIGLTLPDNNLDKIFDLSHGAQLSRWEPSSLTAGAYHAYQAASTDPWLLQLPGRGFWLRSTQPMALNLSGSAATADTKIDFLPGWNQLGNPYVDDVSIATATVKVGGGTPVSLGESNTQGWTRDYMWGYDNAQNSYKLISPSLPFSVSSVKKGAGFFFLATRPGQLIIPNPKTPAPAQVAAAPKQVAVDWVLRLCAATDGVADTDNFLGVSPELAESPRVASPPPARDGFDFYFSTDGARTATAFVKSLGTGEAWQAELTCSRPRAAVKLSWPDLTGLPRECRPILRDLRSGKSVYMRTTNGYNFTLGPNETRRRFVIDISSKAGELLAIRTLQTGTAAGGAQIFYSLSAPAAVDIDIINLAGRVVRRLPSSATQSGACSALWDGLTDSGSNAPGGNYLVRLCAHADDGQAVSAVQTLYLRK